MRKTDRRTLYTRTVIKDAFLELLGSSSYSKLTVTALCKQAEITRATFYLHYEDLENVLEAVLEDALELSPTDIEPGKVFKVLNSSGQLDDSLMPACQRIASLPKYQPLFQDNALTTYLLKVIYSHNKDIMVPYMEKECGIPKALAEKIFIFCLYGNFFVNKSMNWKKDDFWQETQKATLRFIEGGIKALEKEKIPKEKFSKF